MKDRLMKFTTFGRFSTSKLIYQVSGNPAEEKQFKKEAQKILNKLLEFKLSPRERQKISSQNGNWFCTLDQSDIVYMTLTTVDYQERHAYALMTSLKDNFEQMGDYSSEDDTSLKYNAKQVIHSLFDKYSDPDNFDKISQAQNEVELCKMTMNTAIVNSIKNQQDLKQVEDKSVSLNKNASLFSKQAKDLERIMFWRKVKLNLIIAVVVICILCIIILPIVLETSSMFGGSSSEDEKTDDNTNPDENNNNNGGGGGDDNIDNNPTQMISLIQIIGDLDSNNNQQLNNNINNSNSSSILQQNNEVYNSVFGKNNNNNNIQDIKNNNQNQEQLSDINQQYSNQNQQYIDNYKTPANNNIKQKKGFLQFQ